ncbi:hypothetical protein FOZ62_012997 [Perkinsus olseni]|uniref:thermospermine synthase n=1 Tax=Perkinsus olseni TaxID=32597 RepID=A0A7J6TTK5_PEROL|nr:hypothetical protein FOZ62_012997 [Perkinsus olseni]
METATSSYREKVTPSLSYTVGVDKILVEGKSDFQDILLIQSKCFGRTLVLDNQVQSCETDEACYHETLVHPAMLAHPNPKRVYIGGGGEGATAREILKHKSVETCVMVDLDKKVVDFCREHMTQWNNGVFEDPRFTCYYEDAYQWLVENVKTDADKFDVIVMDICDPLDAGPGWKLYTVEFYREVLQKFLNKGGILVTQSTGVDLSYPGNPEVTDPYLTIRNTFKAVFGEDKVRSYFADIPSFFYPWGFTVGSESAEALATYDRSAEEITAELKQRIGEDKFNALRHYDGITHKHMMALPRAAVQREIHHAFKRKDAVGIVRILLRQDTVSPKNSATALHRLARLKGCSKMLIPVLAEREEVLTKLVSHLEERSVDPQFLSNTLFAWSSTEKAIPRCLSVKAAMALNEGRLVRPLEGQNLANTLWAVASPPAHSEGYSERRDLMEAIVTHVVDACRLRDDKILQLSARELAISLWSLGKAYEQNLLDTTTWLESPTQRLARDVLLAALVNDGEVRPSAFTGRDISNILWSAVTLPSVVPAGVNLVEFLREQILTLAKSSWLTTLDLANITWGIHFSFMLGRNLLRRSFSSKANPFQKCYKALGTTGHYYYDLKELGDSRLERLPLSIRVLLESAVRNCDEFEVKTSDVENILNWSKTSKSQTE